MTLTEVVVSVGIGGIMYSGILNAYLLTTRRAEWTAYNLAGHSLAMQRLEQTRAAKWDTQATPPVDQVVSSNFPVTVDILDVPISGTNITYATNFTTISTITSNPPLKLVRVETVWRFPGKKTFRTFTNAISAYRAPDQ